MADMWRPSKQQHYWRRPEYWEESWRLEETCCHSNFSEKPSANADVKNSKRVNNNNNDNDNNNKQIDIYYFAFFDCIFLFFQFLKNLSFSAWLLSYKDDTKPVVADKHPCY